MKFTCEKYLLSLAVATAGRAAAAETRLSAVHRRLKKSPAAVYYIPLI